MPKVPSQSWFDNIAIVLVEPNHPGNIAATARVMAVNGLSDLRLVKAEPNDSEPPPPPWLAWGAENLLSNATSFSDLESCVNEMVYVVGCTRRKRKRGWPELNPEKAAGILRIEASNGPVALIFGPERTGLHRKHLELCHARSAIPQHTDHPSYNLSHAVAIYAYELLLLAGTEELSPAREPASSSSLQHLRRHLKTVLHDLGPAPERLSRDLYRLWIRARPTEGELRLLHRLLQMVASRLTTGIEDHESDTRS